MAITDPSTGDTINLGGIDSKYERITNLKPSGLIITAINLALMIAGLVSFFFLLWGGIQWITAGGDKEGTEKARKRITSALIGLAIVFSTYALSFVVGAVFNINIFNFTLPVIPTA